MPELAGLPRQGGSLTLAQAIAFHERELDRLQKERAPGALKADVRTRWERLNDDVKALRRVIVRLEGGDV